MRNELKATVLGSVVAGGFALLLLTPAVAQTVAAKGGESAVMQETTDGSAPDPLTPAKVDEAPPVAPGAPAATPTDAAPAASAAAPAVEADPLIVAVRQKLADGASSAGAAEREDRAALAAYYGEIAKPIWTSTSGLTAHGTAAVEEIRRAGDWGLEPSAFVLPATPAADAAADILAEAEIKIGLAVLKYARHARGGRIDPNSISNNIDVKIRLYQPKTVLQGIAAAPAADQYLQKLNPQHQGFLNLRQALLIARGQAAAPVEHVSAPAEAAPAADADDKSKSKKRTAKKSDGETAKPARHAENVQRILINMERWRWMPDNPGAFHVWDNVPEQYTRVMKDGKVILKEKIVVGKANTPTPLFSADMKFVIFHPTWGVPDGIKSNELAPLLRRASGNNSGWASLFGGDSGGASRVLSRYNLNVSHNGRPVNPDSIDWGSVDVRRFSFTQPASGRNVLGQVKFRFPNKYDVYMHDTPERNLFNNGTRAFSHGCMRVQNPLKLAEVLLQEDKGWSADKIQSIIARGQTEDVTLTKQIPVHITYFTATADPDGKLHVFSDLYGMDSRVASALAGRSVAVASAPAQVDSTPSETASTGQAQKRDARRTKQTRAAKEDSFNPFAGLFAN